MIDARTALKGLADEVKKIVNDRIHRYGVNPRAKGQNTLEGSELQNSLEVEPTEDGLVLRIADYWWYVATGWKHTRKSPERGLYHELVLWALRKHIVIPGMTANESAVRVAEATWYHMIVHDRPIAPRPFMIPDPQGDLSKMIPELDDYYDKWADLLFNQIIEELDKYFTK